MKVSLLLAFTLGVLCGLAGFALIEGLDASGVTDGVADARLAGLPWGWLVFGYAAQVVFMARMLVQWIATEKKKSSVIPVAFWWLSLLGGLMLLIYFLRRGDPVAIFGQLFGLAVYIRNLILILRRKPATESE